MRCCAVLGALLVLALGAAAPARAFDTGPHGDMTVDALRAEGFGPDAADVARVNNYFVDMYGNPSKVPFNDRSEVLKTILAGAIGNREHWSDALVDSAVGSHMDSVKRVLVDGQRLSLRDATAMEAEWARIRRATFRMVRRARADRSPIELLSAIGASLHPLQDFYSHTNWAETPTDVDGPGWLARGQGSVPTWFDVAKAERDKAPRIYAGGAEGAPRVHGDWADAQSKSLAKDWPGRPRYAESYMTAYFATRQWIGALRTWLADDALWRSAQRFSQFASQLDHDFYGALMISTYSGHLYGEGGPCDPRCGASSGWGGTVVGLRSAVKRYFEGAPKTRFRKAFERMMPMLDDEAPEVPESAVPVQSSRAMQRATRFVRLRVLDYRGLSLGDPGPDDADIYARARIAGQGFIGPIIQAHDRFSFPSPYYPFTFIKAVPRAATQPEPVETITVRVKTSNARYAGTDDHVYLRIGAERFELDKRAYDDFERGDDDTYSVPIDEATRLGLTRGDITRIQLEKSPDRLAGGWKLGAVSVRVNGRLLYGRSGIERWLEDDHRTWRAPDFAPVPARGPKLATWMDLWEDDLRIYGGDDHGDINPYDARSAVAVGYGPGTVADDTVTGGDLLKGRLGIGGDRARLRYRIDTLDTVVPDPSPPLTIKPAG